MADEATPDVQAPEITPEDFMADEQDTAKAAPSTAKPEAPKAEDKPVEAKGKEVEAKGDDTPAPPEVPTKDDKAKPDEAVKPEGEVETPEDKPADKPKGLETRTEKVNSEIRDLVAQRNALKTEVEKLNAEVYQPATEDELTEQGMTAIEAKVEAMRQEREMEKYNSQVADAQLTIGHESNRVLTDFAIFNPDSPTFRKELAEEAAEYVAGNLVRDPNTQQIIGSNVGIYKYYETLARAAQISTAEGQMQGQKDTETMLANADNASSAAPPAKKVDPLTALWDEPL